LEDAVLLKAIDQTQIPVMAKPELRGGHFNCPACKDEVILKAGSIVIPHFAHKACTACNFGTGESLEHLRIKRYVYDHLLTIS